MFGNQRKSLPRYLRALTNGTGASASGECSHSGASLMKTFRDLLLFWQDHYLHKDKDCSALEKVGHHGLVSVRFTFISVTNTLRIFPLLWRSCWSAV